MEKLLDNGLYVPDYAAMLRRANFRSVAGLGRLPGYDGASLSDRLALDHAYRVQQRAHSILNALQASVDTSGSTIYAANASTAAETTQLTISGTAGGQVSPTVPANFFSIPGNGIGRTATVEAWGYASVTGTPTLTFTVRLSSTALDTSGGVIVAISPAITASSGITSKPWYLRLECMCSIQGQGSGAATLQCFGELHLPLAGSATGFAGTTSQIFALTALTAPDQTAWAATFNPAVQNYFSINTTWSASSASNTSTLKFWKQTLNW